MHHISRTTVSDASASAPACLAPSEPNPIHGITLPRSPATPARSAAADQRHADQRYAACLHMLPHAALLLLASRAASLRTSLYDSRNVLTVRTLCSGAHIDMKHLLLSLVALPAAAGFNIIPTRRVEPTLTAGIKPCPGLPAFQLSQSQSSHRTDLRMVLEASSAMATADLLSDPLLALSSIQFVALLGIMESLSQTRKAVQAEQQALTKEIKDLKRGLKREQLFKTLTIEIGPVVLVTGIALGALVDKSFFEKAGISPDLLTIAYFSVFYGGLGAVAAQVFSRRYKVEVLSDSTFAKFLQIKLAAYKTSNALRGTGD